MLHVESQGAVIPFPILSLVLAAPHPRSHSRTRSGGNPPASVFRQVQLPWAERPQERKGRVSLVVPFLSRDPLKPQFACADTGESGSLQAHHYMEMEAVGLSLVVLFLSRFLSVPGAAPLKGASSTASPNR